MIVVDGMVLLASTEGVCFQYLSSMKSPFICMNSA
jgi:hypothetical protein